MIVVILAFACVALALVLAARAVLIPGLRASLGVVPALLVTAGLVGTDGYLAVAPSFNAGVLDGVVVLQAALCPAWIAFSLCYGREGTWRTWSLLNRVLCVLSFSPLVMAVVLRSSELFYLADFNAERVLYLEPRAFFFYLQVVLCMLLAAGNLETTLRSSRHSERWRIKLALVGAGVVLVSFALQYGQGLMFRVHDLGYLGLRNCGITAGLLLLLFAETRRGSGKVSIARRLAFRSVAVVFAGVYLVGLGVAREGVRLFGADFDKQLGMGLVFAAGLAALLVLLSERLRRRASIWLHRTFYNEKYDYRTQWIEFTDRLSRARDTREFIDVMLVGLCEVFGFVGAAFLPADHERDGCVQTGVFYEMNAVAEPPSGDAFAALLARDGVPLLVARLAGELPSGTVRYLADAGATLVLPVRAGEEVEGLVLLSSPIDASEEHDVEDFELMEAMGRQIGLCIRSFRLGDELAVAREMEALGRFAALVMHDLKNQVYALSLLVENSREFMGEPDFQRDMMETLANSVANMRMLITQLTHLPGREGLQLAEVDLMALARRACGQVPGAKLRFTGEGATVQADAEQIGKVFINLCLNAVEANGAGPIVVHVGNDGAPYFRVQDEAGGIDPNLLRNGLFKPFRSTKKRGMGIGLYHCRKIVDAHGGRIRVESRAGQGTTFTVAFGTSEPGRAGHQSVCGGPSPGQG
ncbi:XrtA/PEP-CTERM system histidine kinase PrsK [Nitratidesulfovibrio sp.]|uniref:XrtA/PEP-CTERM system histidine kinase PrsK n=1 Tax=Nitratidesulfovibrio sp. TaxID=2802297 RepID=UPI0033414824